MSVVTAVQDVHMFVEIVKATAWPKNDDLRSAALSRTKSAYCRQNVIIWSSPHEPGPVVSICFLPFNLNMLWYQTIR